MIGQSAAIIAVILVMSFMFLRSGRRAGALLALPLISVPTFHLIGHAMRVPFATSGMPVNALHAAIDILGLASGVIFLLILARGIKHRKLKYVYLACCVFFSAALASAYVSFLI